MNRYVVVPHHGACRARLVRQGRTVLFTTGDGPAAAALAGWCRLFGDRPAADILADLDRVTADNPTLGAFALLVLDDDGVEIAVSGALPVAVHGPGGIEIVEGGTGLVRRRVTDAAVVALTMTGAVVDPLLELDRGTVGADGFEVRISRPTASGSPWAAPGAAAMPAAPETTPESTGATPRPEEPAAVVPIAAAAVVSLQVSGDDELPEAAPLPIAGSGVPGGAPAVPPPAPPDEHDHDAVKVRGLQCARGHFNDPRARYCGVCGIAMHQASFILVEDVRPPLGVLVFGDGSYQTLARTAVVGRDPQDDPAVRSGDADGLALTDPTNTLSRVHAELRLVEWDVEIVDRGSTNGTFVWSPGQTAWERLAPDSSRVLQPGTHVSFGRLTATFESSQRQA